MARDVYNPLQGPLARGSALVAACFVIRSGPHSCFHWCSATPCRCNLGEERQDDIAYHVGRVALVYDGENSLALYAVPRGATRDRVLRLF